MKNCVIHRFWSASSTCAAAGRPPRIVVIPTASEPEDTGRNYEKLFRKLGVSHVRVRAFSSREECNASPDLDYIGR